MTVPVIEIPAQRKDCKEAPSPMEYFAAGTKLEAKNKTDVNTAR
jgi:hypothetical protein